MREFLLNSTQDKEPVPVTITNDSTEVEKEPDHDGVEEQDESASRQ